MSATATHTKESILQKLDSELTTEARREFLRELVHTPGCPIMLMEIAPIWSSNLGNANIEILKLNEYKRMNNSYIDAHKKYPAKMFDADEKIRAAAEVIVDIETTTTAEQLAYERSRRYAEESLILLGEVLDEFEAENQATTMAP